MEQRGSGEGREIHLLPRRSRGDKEFDHMALTIRIDHLLRSLLWPIVAAQLHIFSPLLQVPELGAAYASSLLYLLSSVG